MIGPEPFRGVGGRQGVSRGVRQALQRALVSRLGGAGRARFEAARRPIGSFQPPPSRDWANIMQPGRWGPMPPIPPGRPPFGVPLPMPMIENPGAPLGVGGLGGPRDALDVSGAPGAMVMPPPDPLRALRQRVLLERLGY